MGTTPASLSEAISSALVFPGGAALSAIVALVILLSGRWQRGTFRAGAAQLLAPLVGAWQGDSASITPLPGACFGAEISGVDLHEHLLPQTAQMLQNALNKHGLLLFRGSLPLKEPDLLGMAEIFGTPTSADSRSPLVALYRVKDRDREPMGADFWHSDNSYMPIPGGPTVLYALKVPRDTSGAPFGDTLFADAEIAAAELPSSLRKKLNGLEALHSLEHNGGVELPARYFERGLPRLSDVSHPVLRENPVSGRTALFVSPAYVREVVGMAREDSQALLEQLYAHMLKPDYVYRHQWRTGDLLVWDNSRLLHRATTLDMPPGAERVMLRIQTAGASRVG